MKPESLGLAGNRASTTVVISECARFGEGARTGSATQVKPLGRASNVI